MYIYWTNCWSRIKTHKLARQRDIDYLWSIPRERKLKCYQNICNYLLSSGTHKQNYTTVYIFENIFLISSTYPTFQHSGNKWTSLFLTFVFIDWWIEQVSASPSLCVCLRQEWTRISTARTRYRYVCKFLQVKNVLRPQSEYLIYTI